MDEKINEIEEINIIISHNKIIIVDSFEKWEKDSWKFSTWYDNISERQYNIIDKDYWKSAELMRMLLEEQWSTSWFMKKILIWWGFLAWIVMLLIAWSIFFWWEQQEDEPEEIRSPIQESIQPDFFDIEEEQEERDEVVIESQECIEASNRNELEILNYQLSNERSLFKIRSLESDLNMCSEKIAEKDSDINRLSWDLRVIQQDIQNQPQKDAREEFFIHLGSELSKKCESSNDEKVKDSCKELYYNYLQND